MSRKIAAVVGGVVLGIAIGFARAGAFPFWSSGSPQATPHASPVPKSEAPAATHEPAPANQPEPTERLGGRRIIIKKLVKRVMPWCRKSRPRAFHSAAPKVPKAAPKPVLGVLGVRGIKVGAAIRLVLDKARSGRIRLSSSAIFSVSRCPDSLRSMASARAS